MSLRELTTHIENWAEATGLGNHLFRQAAYADARKHYDQALLYSEAVLRHPEDAMACDVSFIIPFHISCVNLSIYYETTAETGRSGSYLLYGVWHLWQLSRCADLDPQTQAEAVRTWRRAVKELYSFHERTGQPLSVDFLSDETYEQIRKAKNVIGMGGMNLN